MANIGKWSEFESKIGRNKIVVLRNGHARDMAHMMGLIARFATLKLLAPRNSTRTIVLPVKIEKPESK